MNIPQLVIRLLIAVICAGLADILVPRRIPGGFAGLIVLGLLANSGCVDCACCNWLRHFALSSDCFYSVGAL